MKELEKRFYSRQEIANKTKTPVDAPNFRRTIITRVTNWGYELDYSAKGIYITKCPETTEAKIHEIVMRVFDMNKQTDTTTFALFFTLIAKDKRFASETWRERETIMRTKYNSVICFCTLQTWSLKLFKLGYFAREDGPSHSGLPIHIEEINPDTTENLKTLYTLISRLFEIKNTKGEKNE